MVVKKFSARENSAMKNHPPEKFSRNFVAKKLRERGNRIALRKFSAKNIRAKNRTIPLIATIELKMFHVEHFVYTI